MQPAELGFANGLQAVACTPSANSVECNQYCAAGKPVLRQPNCTRLHTPSCLVQSHRDEDVVAAVNALAAAIASGGSQLRRLQIDIRGSAFFVLPSGTLVPARLLEQPVGRSAQQDRWPGLHLLPVPERSLTPAQLRTIATGSREPPPRCLVLTWPHS